jgi:CBS domain-containing protein
MKSDPQVVDCETTVTDAAYRMIQTGQDTVIVVEGDTIKGTVDLRNLLRYTYTQGFRPHQTPIGEITNKDIILARPNTSLEDCLTIMTELKQSTLPVVDGELVGSINIHDLLKAQPKTKPHLALPEIA